MATKAQQPFMIVFYLATDFSLLEFSLAVETLRLTNEALGYQAYRWRLASENGDKINASCGVELTTSCSIDEEKRNHFNDVGPTMICICSDDVAIGVASSALKSWLFECRNRDIKLGAVGSGSHLLAQSGILDGKKCAVHWRNVENFVQQFITTVVDPGIFRNDDTIWTCAGGTATIDMMLHLVEQDFGKEIIRAICDRAVKADVRCGNKTQHLRSIKQWH